MKRLQLTDWAAVAEIIGTIGLIVSLIFVAFSINSNTSEVRAAQRNYVYDSTREIDLAVASDEEWSRIVIKGSTRVEQMSAIEQFRYDAYLTMVLDIWIEMGADDLMDVTSYEAWEHYFVEWAKRHITKNDWQRIKWNYTGDGDPDTAKWLEAEIFTRPPN